MPLTPNQEKTATTLLKRLETHIQGEMKTAQEELPINAKTRLTTEVEYILSQYAEAKISDPSLTTKNADLDALIQRIETLRGEMTTLIENNSAKKMHDISSIAKAGESMASKKATFFKQLIQEGIDTRVHSPVVMKASQSAASVSDDESLAQPPLLTIESHTIQTLFLAAAAIDEHFIAGERTSLSIQKAFAILGRSIPGFTIHSMVISERPVIQAASASSSTAVVYQIDADIINLQYIELVIQAATKAYQISPKEVSLLATTQTFVGESIASVGSNIEIQASTPETSEDKGYIAVEQPSFVSPASGELAFYDASAEDEIFNSQTDLYADVISASFPTSSSAFSDEQQSSASSAAPQAAQDITIGIRVGVGKQIIDYANKTLSISQQTSSDAHEHIILTRALANFAQRDGIPARIWADWGLCLSERPNFQYELICSIECLPFFRDLTSKAGVVQIESDFPSTLPVATSAASQAVDYSFRSRGDLIAREMKLRLSKEVGSLLDYLINGPSNPGEGPSLEKLKLVQLWLNNPEITLNEQNAARIFALIKDICQGPKKNMVISFFTKTPASVVAFDEYLGKSPLLNILKISEQLKKLVVNSGDMTGAQDIEGLINLQPVERAASAAALS